MISKEVKIFTLKIINNAIKAGARKKEAVKIINISIRTLQRWESSVEDKRTFIVKNPPNKLSCEEREEIIDICCSDRFKDLSPNIIVPLLADDGQYIASESTMYRILKTEKLLQHRTNCQPINRYKPPVLQANGPNQLWSWDITYLKTSIRGKFFYLYLFMDVWSRAIVGWSIYENQSSELAAQLISDICLANNVSSVNLHSDNGGPMKGATMLATLERLGVVPSFSRPSVSNDNPYSESLFKTVKYNAGYPPNYFNSREEAIEWFTKFTNWYNETHLHSGIKFVTPMQRHRGEHVALLQKRTETYSKAKLENPIRWSRNTRNWKQKEIVYLNPSKEKSEAA
jgi:transposase InsO family protein